MGAAEVAMKCAVLGCEEEAGIWLVTSNEQVTRLCRKHFEEYWQAGGELHGVEYKVRQGGRSESMGWSHRTGTIQSKFVNEQRRWLQWLEENQPTRSSKNSGKPGL